MICHIKKHFTRIIITHSLTLHQNRILTTVAYTCFPNESMSQASTPINSQSVSEDRTLPLSAPHTHTHTYYFPLGAHTCPHHPRNVQTSGNASDLHHNEIKRCNVRGGKKPRGKSHSLMRKCERSIALISAQYLLRHTIKAIAKATCLIYQDVRKT